MGEEPEFKEESEVKSGSGISSEQIELLVDNMPKNFANRKSENI